MSLVFNVISMLGGLAMFLYGMNLLGGSLEKVSGGRLEQTLEKMTSNIFKGVLVGLVVTAAIQSSSATTVIVVGLVNAGILKLRSAVGVIMGANIGTTVTGQILRLAELDSTGSAGFILEFIKPTTLAPVVMAVGIVLMMAAKRKKSKIIGEILMGFGILFNGMFLMTDSIEPLSQLPAFSQIFATLQNPFLGVLAGTLVTAIIQSSSASVGILQALAATGQIQCCAAFPIIMGQNIGTCVTSLISSIGATVNAKRAAMVHLYFNIIGTIIFMAGVYSLNGIFQFSFWNEAISMGGIANFHTLFNVVVTLLLLPFAKGLEKLAVMTVRSKAGEEGPQMYSESSALDDRFLVSPSLALGQCSNVIIQMGAYANKNFNESYDLFNKYQIKTVDSINQFEDAIDKMEDRVNDYLLKLTSVELSNQESRMVTHLLKLDTEFERIGDYSVNLVECAEMLSDREAKLSVKAMEELKVLYEATDEIIQMARECFKSNDLKVANKVEPLEETIDMMVDTLKVKHIERLKKAKCTIDGGFVFLEALTNIERISDHCSNIAVAVIGYHHEQDSLNRHEYIKKIHEGGYEDFNTYMSFYKQKYLDRISVKKVKAK
jgi:phosphate:Na+ symporter